MEYQRCKAGSIWLARKIGIAVAKTKELETTSDPTQGVILKCLNINGKL